MIGKLKRKFFPLVLVFAGGLIFGGHFNYAQDNTPKLNNSLTRIESQERQVNRAEIIVRDLPFNSDIYTLLEDYEGNYFNKYRVQTIPLKTENLSLGLVEQYKSSSFFESYSQFGLVGRLQCNPTRNTFGKIDLRYFAEEKDFEVYAFLGTQELYLDFLAGKNLDTDSTYVVLGVDLKLRKNLSIGVEASFSGERKLEEDYIGIRAKLSF